MMGNRAVGCGWKRKLRPEPLNLRDSTGVEVGAARGILASMGAVLTGAK